MSQLGKVCHACGRERSKTKSILFDPETLYPYCESPYICTPQHPNAPANLLERGYELKLIPLTDAQRLFKDHLIKTIGDPEKIKKIRNMVDKPMTLRIGDPELAKFILDLQDSYGFSSVSDSIRYCIQMMKENKGQMYRDFKEVEMIQKDRKEEKEFVEAIEQDKPLPDPEPEEVDDLEDVEEETEEVEWTF